MRKEGCHSSILGDGPRGRTTESWMQAGWRHVIGAEGQMSREPVMVRVRTRWMPIPCGIKKQAGYADAGCAGCLNYPENNNK